MSFKIVIHDYAGHPFQISLSRELAKRGYYIYHIYNESFISPRGYMKKRNNDPDNFFIYPISFPNKIPKSSLLKRWLYEYKYAKLIEDLMGKINPNLIISGNATLDIQRKLINYSIRKNIPFVFWVQDIVSEAIKQIVMKKIPILGQLIWFYYRFLEKQLYDKSDFIVVISEDFIPFIGSNNVNKVMVIHNWAPIEEIKITPKYNNWSRRNNLHDKFVFLYTGTLGYKHDPKKLLYLALFFKNIDSVRIVVNSEGEFARWLKEEAAKLGLSNLLVYPFQPFEEMSDVLGTADVLVALLEKSAGAFSVPSKILTYLCSGRPILASIPKNNLAAKIINQINAGFVVEPDNLEDFLKKANILYLNNELRNRMGLNAIKFAENNFKIDYIADKFETIINKVIKNKLF